MVGRAGCIEYINFNGGNKNSYGFDNNTGI